jgi:predicted acylesterase/phospholipase RssA
MLELAARHPIEPDACLGAFGVDTGKGLVAFIRRLLNVRGKLTLADLHARTGKTLRICVCNLTKRRAEYWTHETHPGVSLVHALRISCSVPLLFAAISYKGDLYVDGAVSNALPAADCARALAIGFDTPPTPIDTIQDFLDAMRASVQPMPTPRYFVKLDPTAGSDAFDLSPSPEDMRAAFATGRRLAAKWVKKIK